MDNKIKNCLEEPIYIQQKDVENWNLIPKEINKY